MKVALCCIGRLENQYAVEYVEYYKKLGVDKIFIYDNNYGGEEYFEDVLQPYIDEGLVEITDFRNKSVCQLEAYQDCYNKHGNEYDWIAFFDFDEYLTFKNTLIGIKDFLSSDKFKNCNLIHVNWMCYGDNDLIYYEDKPLLERFTKPVEPLDFKRTYDFPENNHIKSIVRGGLKGVFWKTTPHTPIGADVCVNAAGIKCDASSPFNKYDFSVAWLRHFQMKTIEEFYEIKVKRGYPDGNKNYFKDNNWYDAFFTYNKRTVEKENFVKNINKLDIFICTHKDFEPAVHNEIYKVINANDINGDIAENGLKGSFYSEILSYLYVAKNYKLKDYVGFCHYRKYWNFMDNIPDINNIINQSGIILAKPLKFSKTVKEQYKRCHSIDDIYILSGIISEYYPDYITEWNAFLSSNVFFPYNMFIMRKEEFLEYVNFVKIILDKYVDIVGANIEDRIINNKDKYLKDFSPNNEIWYQYRIGGYLAERLTNLWIIKHHKKAYICDVKITEEKYHKNGQ